MPADLAPHCNPAQHVSMMLMQGTGDTFMPAQGGSPKGEGGTIYSDRETFAFWAKTAQCQGSAKMQTLSNYHLFSAFRPRILTPTPITFYHYENCGGNEVGLLEIADGGHMWPGSYKNFGALFGTGKVSDFPVNKAIIEFFLRHAKE